MYIVAAPYTHWEHSSPDKSNLKKFNYFHLSVILFCLDKKKLKNYSITSKTTKMVHLPSMVYQLSWWNKFQTRILCYQERLFHTSNDHNTFVSASVSHPGVSHRATLVILVFESRHTDIYLVWWKMDPKDISPVQLTH